MEMPINIVEVPQPHFILPQTEATWTYFPHTKSKQNVNHQLDMRKKLLMVRAVQQWKGKP